MSQMRDDVLPIVRETRGILLPHYGTAEPVRNKGAHSHDVVTELDLTVETFLKERLGKLYPEIAFAGEEYGGDRSAERFWLCDPIDGTSHFVRGLPFCTVMLALVERGEVTFSVIYDFVNDCLYHAEKGKGAFGNGVPIRVNGRTLHDAYIAYETHLDKQENLDIFLKLREKVSFFKAMCSGYEYVLVATGKLEGRVVFDGWGYDWDYAPGSLLVSEAGGKVANLGVTTYEYQNKNFLAANPIVFDALTTGTDAIFPIEKQ